LSRLDDAENPQRVSTRNIPTFQVLAVIVHLWSQSKKMNTFPSTSSAKAATANLAETARGAVESMRNTAQDVTKQGQEALSQAGAAATKMADSTSRQVTTFASEISKMTRDNPLGALAAATMFGVLVGLLLRGRSNSE
jgi:ElaB/YqjD/DUF883 family membrane-anchored ribosome-binding protein